MSLVALCVLSWAVPASAGENAEQNPQAAVSQDISGRWEGRSYELARAGINCGDEPCLLTLDVVKCAKGWCGVEVLGTEQRCGATALKLDAGTGEPPTARVFKGHLELAKGTEPYVVEVYLVTGGGEVPELQIVGDTGGEFRAFRRSFPFSATLARRGEPQCRPDATVSLLD